MGVFGNKGRFVNSDMLSVALMILTQELCQQDQHKNL